MASLLLSLGVTFAMFGCGGGGGDGSSHSEATLKATVNQGSFIDSPVAGLHYQTRSRDGVTDADGTFYYLDGETVTFFFAGMELGAALGSEVITPLDLMPNASDVTDPEVTNLARLLQTLDEDNDPNNGIVLTPSVEKVVESFEVDFSLPPGDFGQSSAVKNLLASLHARNIFQEEIIPRNLISAQEAQNHLRASLNPADTDGDGFTVEQGDCNDSSAEIFPQAEEVCGDGVDQNCDGRDDACPVAWYHDDDRDGYSDGKIIESPLRPSDDYAPADELIAVRGDCNDAEASIHPEAEETCGDGIDQDCSGKDLECPKEIELTWYLDKDFDRFGDGRSLNAVERPGEAYFLKEDLESVSGDCNDQNAAIHPGAEEICGDGIDQDCSGKDVACAKEWFYDGDGDSYGTGHWQLSLERPGLGYKSSGELKAVEGDCNDENAAIHPGAEEVCGDGIDQDCNGADLTCPEPEEKTWYQDFDDDRYSDGESINAIERPAPYYFLGEELERTSGDCNDGEKSIHPGAEEICGDGIDQDCSGSDLICQQKWFIDFDGDGYGNGEWMLSGDRPGEHYYRPEELTALEGDCNDVNGAIHPGGEEVCSDGIDQDCQEGDLICPGPEETIWYRDDDRDRFSDGTSITAAEPPSDDYFPAEALEATSGDCNDVNADIHPGAEEVCGDGIDQDCSGADKECGTVESAWESQLRALINEYRVQNGLGVLDLDPALWEMARDHSIYMKQSGDFGHSGFQERAQTCFSLGYFSAAENVGFGYPSPEQMFNGWKNSPGHNANMLNARTTHVGVAEYELYWTMLACGD